MRTPEKSFFSRRSGIRSSNAFPLAFRSAEFITPDRRRIYGMVLLALLIAALGAAEPLVSKFLFDALSRPRPLHLLAGGIAALLAVEIARAVLSGWLSTASWNTRLRVDHRLREQLIGKLFALPIGYHRHEQVGGTINRINQAITGFLSTFMEVVLSITPAVVFLLLSLAAMLRLDWRLCLVVLAFTPFPTLLGMLAAREQAQRERTLLDIWSKLYARLNEVLSGIVTVKGFAREHEELTHFLHTTRAGNEIVRAGVCRDTLTTGARNFAATLARIAAIGYGGYLVLNEEISLGTLVAFLGYIGGLFGPVQGLTNVYQTLRRGQVALETIYGILDQDDGVCDAPGARDAGTLRGEVHFQDVCFAYPDSEPVLRGINLEIRPGERIALVGPSGAGKSTLVSLLQRQYNVTGGRILLDGMDIRTLTQRSLRKQIGAVFQEVHLFNDTVHANIAYGLPEASRKEVEAAARAAHAHDFILALPHGYDTVLGERGNRLSGGQRQRLAIARALLLNPPILILDEATSALDARSEALVQEALRVLARGRTTLIVAHRLSTLTDADRIVVLRDGCMEAVGRHDELLFQNEYFATLVQHQAGGFLQEAPLELMTQAA